MKLIGVTFIHRDTRELPDEGRVCEEESKRVQLSEEKMARADDNHVIENNYLRGDRKSLQRRITALFFARRAQTRLVERAVLSVPRACKDIPV